MGGVGLFVKATTTEMEDDHLAACLNADMHLSSDVLLVAAKWFGALQCVPKPNASHLATKGRITDFFSESIL